MNLQTNNRNVSCLDHRTKGKKGEKSVVVALEHRR